MKKLLLMIALVIVSAISFYLGRNYEYQHFGEKDYEAACLEADFIRYITDHFDGETECADIGMEINNCYEEWFGELDNGNFNTKHITHIKDLDEYYWCY